MNTETLTKTAQQMVARGKGIIAADESNASCEKRFEAVNTPCTPETRAAYRETLLAAPGIEEYVSGVILFDETFWQKTSTGATFPEILAQKGILPGIKVDLGLEELALHPGEKITKGLDTLRERLAAYATAGAKFAKWRAVITIGTDMPSVACIRANTQVLARYAALCQEAGIVPMVEPEVLIDGAHTIDQCFDATRATLAALFEEVQNQGVLLEGLILKSSMVIAGKESGTSSAEEVAQKTLNALNATVPHALPGVVFLSGGQGDEQATENLNAMNRLGAPWPLTFSYSRAIQHPVLQIWAKDPANNGAAAQDALRFRLHMNSLAATGAYTPDMG